MGLLNKKKVKKQIPRVEYPNTESEEDIYEQEVEQEEESGEEAEESIDTQQMPVMPKPSRTTRRLAQQKKESEESITSPQYSVSEYFDIIEGNIKRAYIALDELRRLEKV